MIRRAPAPPKFQIKPGKPVKDLAVGERITMAVFVQRTQSRHEFTATIIGESPMAIRIAFKSGPPDAPQEHLMWMPKSWTLAPAPRCANVWWLPKKKADELGSKVLTFN